MAWPTLSLHAAALWSGLLIVWLLGLSVLVVMRRRRHRVLFGEGGEAEMTTAVRAFGNAAEYIPPGIGALILLGCWASPRRGCTAWARPCWSGGSSMAGVCSI